MRVTGERAFFARPEFRSDRVSYDIIVPRVARGLFDHVHWRPTIRWTVERIYIRDPGTIEIVDGGAGGGSGRTMLLRHVDYHIQARLELLPQAPASETLAEHTALFRRRCARPRPGTRLYLGRPDFVAAIELMDSFGEEAGAGVDRDFGWLPHDAPYQVSELSYFRAVARSGIVIVPVRRPDQLFA